MYMTCMTMHHPHQPSHIGAGPVLAPPDSWARAAIRGERRYPKRMFCRVGGEPIFLRRVLHVCTERALLPYALAVTRHTYKDTQCALASARHSAAHPHAVAHAPRQHLPPDPEGDVLEPCTVIRAALVLASPFLCAGFAVLCSPRPLNSARSAALCATQGTWPAVVELCRRWREPSSALLVASLCRG